MYHFCKALVLWQFDNVEYGGSTSFVLSICKAVLVEI